MTPSPEEIQAMSDRTKSLFAEQAVKDAAWEEEKDEYYRTHKKFYKVRLSPDGSRRIFYKVRGNRRKPGRPKGSTEYKGVIGEHVKRVVEKGQDPKKTPEEIDKAIALALPKIEPVGVFMEALLKNGGDPTLAMLELQPQLSEEEARKQGQVWVRKSKSSEIYEYFIGTTLKNIDDLLRSSNERVKQAMTIEVMDRVYGKAKNSSQVEININHNPISEEQKLKIAERIMRKQVEVININDTENE